MVKCIVSGLLLFSLLISIKSDECPQYGYKGVKSFPELFTQMLDHNGYQAVVEVIEIDVDQNSYRRCTVKDNYNGLTKTGTLEVYDHSKGDGYKSYYYPSTNEIHNIRNGNCYSTDFSIPNQQQIYKQWTSVDYSSVVNFTNQLGPIGLLNYLIAHREELQFINGSSNDGVENKSYDFDQTNHWFICLSSDGPFVDVYFDSTEERIIAMNLTFPSPSTLVTFNYALLKPTEPDSNEVSYPYGYGCQRPLPDSKAIPSFAESTYFSLNMEASIHYYNPVGFEMTSLNMVKSNKIYSYDISSQNGSFVRIIHDPDLLFDYVIDLSVGSCSHTESSLIHESYLRWPYSSASRYNLLSPSIMQLNRQDLNYLGTIKLESEYDIFEKKVTSFFETENSYVPAIITYFFPVSMDGSYKMLPKIEIVPRQNSEKALMQFNKIDINVGYLENTDSTFDSNRFDLSLCYEASSQFKWFEIVFEIVPEYILSIQSRQFLLEKELRKTLGFVSIDRFTEVKVGHYGPSIFIIGKLLEGVDFRLHYFNAANMSLENPSEITFENHDAECAQLCTNDPDCKSFSYCDDRRCNILRGASIPQMIESIGCTFYIPRDVAYDEEGQGEKDKYLSSDQILHQISLMVHSRQLKLSIGTSVITADKLLIVSNPNELGDYGEVYEDEDQSSKLNGYKVVLSGHKIRGTIKVTGLNYADCLDYCENDNACLTISYCSNGDGECTISPTSSSELLSNISKYTEYNDYCTLIGKSLLDYFEVVPGRSLMSTASHKLEDVTSEECAKVCIEDTQLNCEAFYFCSNFTNKGVCYFYADALNFSKNTTSKIWDSSSEPCYHYSRKLTKDYKQFIGMKFNDFPVITSTLNRNSLENCASLCNSADESCTSFEYCTTTYQEDSIKSSSCRLSSDQVIDDIRYMQSTTEFCSVYGISRNKPTTIVNIKYGLNGPLAIFCGVFSFLFAAILTAFLTSFFLKAKTSDYRNL